MFNGKRIVDLTMPINKDTPNYPGDPLPKIRDIATIKSSGWNEKRISFNTHFATHIEAPYHMLEEGKKLSDYSVEIFFVIKALTRSYWPLLNQPQKPS